jgi:6-phosphogluconolactonase
VTELLYVGCYTKETGGDGPGLAAYVRDGARLREVAAVATPSPSYVIADRARKLVFAVNETPEGAVSSFTVEPDGSLRPLSTSATGGDHPCHLALHDGHVLAGNYTSGSVSVHPVGPDGVLGPRTDLVQHEGHGPNGDRQEGPHAHQVLIAPDGTVAVIDLGIDRLLHYRLNDGRLSPVGETAMPPGSGPRHAVIDHADRWFVAAELDSTVLVCARDSESGKLAVRERHPTTASTVEGGNAPSAIALSANDRYVYVANRGANTIATFVVSDAGKLSPVGEVPCGGDWPRDGAVVGDLMFVANQHSHTVVAFRLDPDTGLPRPTGDVLEIGSPACILPVDLSPAPRIHRGSD